MWQLDQPLNAVWRFTWLKFTGLLVALCLLALLPGHAQAQDPQIRFERLTLEDGLSHGTVFSIVQDQAGLMWFGTQSGLNRYDGYNITVYKHDPMDLNTVSNDNAGNLFIDRAGMIWIGTWGGGLDRLDPRTDQFTHYFHNPDDPASLSADRVQTIFEDSRGNLWVGTSGGGLNKFDPATETFTHYRHQPNNPNSLSHDRVWRIVEDKAGRLWIATSNGLNRFDPLTETFSHYKHDPANPTSLTDNLVRTLYIDRAGTLWVGTETGLDRFDPPTDSFTHFKNQPNDPHSLSDNIINAIFEDSSGNIWIGTSQGGLNQFDRQSETFTHYLNDPLRANSLSNNDVRWILEDRAGVLWVATRGGGVNKFVPTLSNFIYMGHDPNNPNTLNNNDVRAILQDRANNLWIGTKGGGLNKFDPQSGLFTVYQSDPNDPSTISSDDVRAIYEDRAGQLWLGLSGGGLNRLDPTTGDITRYLPNPDNANSLSHVDVNSIYQDRAGLLWIGTKGGGLNKFDPQTGQFTVYRHDANDPNSLGNDDVYGLHQDSAGMLWVATYGGGLNRFDPATGQFVRYQYDLLDPNSLSNNDVYTIYQDQAGILWVGTANGGLNKFDPATGQFTHLGEAEGLNSQVVYGVLADEAGNLWLSTAKGLSKFNPRSNTFISYDASDGLESIGYNEGAYYQSRTGEMFFGGTNGLLRFFPDKIKENNHPPSVVITGFSQPGRTEPLGGQPISQLEVIELSHEDDVFSFEFAALDFTNPAKNQFAYKLEGFDQDWILTGNRNFATYTNLDPGEYTFQVKSANNAGVWNEQGASIRIVVTPPFWETWWFRIGALLVVAAAALTTYKLRVRSIKAQREKLRLLVNERTAELSEANENLRLLTDRLQAELAMAQHIERSLLPPPRPNWPGLDVLCYSASAREVGGDFYAYHSFDGLPDDGNGHQARPKFALAVGDASGKGMPAALLMAVSLASFQSAIDSRLNPAKLLARLDETIRPYTRTGYQNCAFCYIEIIPDSSPEKRQWRLSVANAGCVPPLLRRASGRVEWIEIGGTPLGIGLGASDGYREECAMLYAGDLVILTSDGVIEAMTAAREMFGFERLEQAIAGGPTQSAEAMVDHLRRAVESFIAGAEPHDDLTIVALQV